MTMALYLSLLRQLDGWTTYGEVCSLVCSPDAQVWEPHVAASFHALLRWQKSLLKGEVLRSQCA